MASGARFRLNLHDRPQLIAYLLRAYAPEIVSCIAENLPHGGTFFDVGGHVGLIALTVAVLRPDAAIYSFEPNPSNAAAWRYNQSLNPAGSARLIEAGLSDHDGVASFSVPGNTASGMIIDGGTQSVPVMTLDRYCADMGIERIDVMKMDVEGHEPAVLRGAAGLLKQHAITAILSEVTEALLQMRGEGKEVLLSRLEECGYQVSSLPEVGLRRHLPIRFQHESGDLLFKLPTSPL